MSRALLDVNVLLALLDRDHLDHEAARRWLESQISEGWASCPITQNGFIRILSQPRYPGSISPSQAIEKLNSATNTPHHEFWPCDLSLLEPEVVDRSRIYGTKQVTDCYLLALAAEHESRFATFDTSVSVTAVSKAGGENLVVIPT